MMIHSDVVFWQTAPSSHTASRCQQLPSVVLVVDAIPKNAMGKVNKRALPAAMPQLAAVASEIAVKKS